MKNAVHILLIQLFNCNWCKVRIITWFNCFNSSHQLIDRIFLSRRSITHCLDTNLSLYNFPSLFLSSDVIHSGQNSFSLFMNFYLVLFLLSLSSLTFTARVSMSLFVRAMCPWARRSSNWGHLYVRARTLGPAGARMRSRFGARPRETGGARTDHIVYTLLRHGGQ